MAHSRFSRLCDEETISSCGWDGADGRRVNSRFQSVSALLSVSVLKSPRQPEAQSGLTVCTPAEGLQHSLAVTATHKCNNLGHDVRAASRSAAHGNVGRFELLHMLLCCTGFCIGRE